MRTFISIDIPSEIRNEIKKIQESLPQFMGKITELENLHLTLKFLGEIDENKLEQIKEKLSKVKIKPFEVELEGLGVFSPDYIRIIWIHLAGVEELQKIIDEKLVSIFPMEKRFMSHLTIARVKTIKNKTEFLGDLKKIKIPKLKFLVNSFKIKKSILSSKGPIHETIKEYFLEKGNIIKKEN
jgi:2'-5' RNA ligase